MRGPKPSIEKLKQRIIDYSEPVTESGCWIWTKSLDGRGYGQLCSFGKLGRAHRISYQLFVGEIPPRMFVCHRCDTPACVNPSHLWLGTSKDNARDACSKGRARGGSMKGETHPFAKLNDDDVISIRRNHAEGVASYEALAAEHGVSKGAIAFIVRRRTWRHVN